MDTGPWYPGSEHIDQVRAFLRGPMCASAPGSRYWLPALYDVLATHVEKGFVHLPFTGWPPHRARAVTDQLLHPDALLVPDASGPSFEGFGWDGEPPAAVLARQPQPQPPDLPPCSPPGPHQPAQPCTR